MSSSPINLCWMSQSIRAGVMFTAHNNSRWHLRGLCIRLILETENWKRRLRTACQKWAGWKWTLLSIYDIYIKPLLFLIIFPFSVRLSGKLNINPLKKKKNPQPVANTITYLLYLYCCGLGKHLISLLFFSDSWEMLMLVKHTHTHPLVAC